MSECKNCEALVRKGETLCRKCKESPKLKEEYGIPLTPKEREQKELIENWKRRVFGYAIS